MARFAGPAQLREETADSTKQPAKPGTDYDTTRFYLVVTSRAFRKFVTSSQRLVQRENMI